MKPETETISVQRRRSHFRMWSDRIGNGRRSKTQESENRHCTRCCRLEGSDNPINDVTLILYSIIRLI